MNTAEEYGLFSKNVAEQLGVSKDTVRSWSIKLENLGVEFERNEHKQRAYYPKDIRAFQDMKRLLDLQQPMKEVSRIVAENIEKGLYDKLNSMNNAEITPSVIHDNHEEITQDQRMDEFKNELISELRMTVKQEAVELARIILEDQQRMLPDTSKQDELLENIYSSVQELRLKNDIETLAQKYDDLLSEHNQIIKTHNKAIDAINEMQSEIKQLREVKIEYERLKVDSQHDKKEIQKLKDELEKEKNKKWWQRR